MVIELKRSAVGTLADLQALRYAAYCSALGLDDLAELYATYANRRGSRDVSPADARTEIEEFIESPDFEEFDEKPRIILGAQEFPPEMTATLLWLRSFDVDISAVRLRPHRVNGTLLIDSAVLIPLPEAKDFLIRREKKEVLQAARAKGRGQAYLAWFQPLLDELREEHAFTNARAAQPQNWYTFTSGTPGFGYSTSFSHQGLRVEVYMDLGDRDATKAAFDRLYADRDALEAAFGSPLSWERLEKRRASRVAAYRELTIDDSDEALNEGRKWAISGLLSMKRVFGPKLASLSDR